MTAVNDILQQLPVAQLAEQLGTDADSVEKASVPAVTSLLGGLTQNAQDPAGAQALAQALNDHAGRSLLDGGLDVNQIDASEGQKILGHVFGNQTEGVAQALGGQAGVSSSLVSKLLPILAPIVMAYLAKQLTGQGGAGNILGQILGQASGQTQTAQDPAAGGNVLGGVLSNVLGQVLGQQTSGNPFDPTNAQTTQAPAAGAGDIVSQILGGLLGKK